MTTITLHGAGGKMGCRLTDNFLKTPYKVHYLEIAPAMYVPVSRAHRVTLEQMAMLEPALVETLAQTCMEIVKEGHDRLVAAGVPKEAVRDFVLGHLRIQIAVLFGEVNGTFSDAAYKISQRAKPVLFKEGWQKIFEMSDIREDRKSVV